MSPVGLSYVHFKAVLKAYSGHIIKPTEDFVTLHSSAAHLSKVKAINLNNQILNTIDD